MKLLYILSVLLLFCIYVIIDKKREGLQDIDDTMMKEIGPITYKRFVKMLKYPNRIVDATIRNEIEDITKNNPFTSENFRKNTSTYRKKYQDEIMENDFKFFNNSSNLLLYNIHNLTKDQKADIMN